MKSIFIFIVMMLPMISNAEVTQGGQFWSLNFIRSPIGESGLWNYFIEIQPRLDFENSKLNRILFRPAVIYQMDPDQSFWIGAMDVFDSAFLTKELRIWEQYLRTDHSGAFQIQNRTRFEQRFVSEAQGMGWRLRHMLRFQVPIKALEKWSAVFFDEFFLAFNAHPLQTHEGFDQNRAFLGLRRDFNQGLFYEFGYLNQFTGKRMNHNPFLTVGKTFR